MSIVAETSAPAVPTGEWSIDPAWSALEFQVDKLGLLTIKGRAPGFTGTIRGGESASIEGRVDVTSITTFDETRDGHLQSPDFFDAARYPELRFASTRVSGTADELVVEGELMIKGVTRSVILSGRYVGEGVDAMGQQRIGLELETTIDRGEFGLVWNAPLPSGGLLLPDEVTLTATLAAVRAG